MDDTTYDPQAGTRFPTTKLLEGYEVAAVDAFVMRAERAVSMRDGSVTVAEVEKIRFAPVRFRTGYQMDDVDNHLERLVEQLTAIEATASSAPTAASAPADLAGHCPGCRCAELGPV